MRRVIDAVGVPVVLSACVVVAALVGSLGPASLDRTVVVSLINVLFVVSLYVFVGNSGVWSFGHLAFAALGAYTAGILVMPHTLKSQLLPDAPGVLGSVSLPPVAAVIAGGLMAALFAVIVVVPLSRISGLSAGLATVALLISVRVIAGNWESVTRAKKSLSSIPISTTRNGALAWVVIVIFVAWAYQRSTFGKRLRASKSDEVAAAAAGIAIPLQRSIAFVISAFFTGVGGALFALFLGSVGPDVFYLDLTFLIITMLVVGGPDSLTGAVGGAIGVSAVAEILRRAEAGRLVGLVDIPARPGIQRVILGSLVVVILLRRPGGLIGPRELSLGARRPRPAPRATSNRARTSDQGDRMSDSDNPIGVLLHGATAPARLGGLSRTIEGAGFGSLWLSEDYFFLGGISSAAIALQATESIDVGIGILSAVVRHPAVTAMEIATLTNAFPDRLHTGIGHGLPVWTQQMGLYPKSPLRALREVVESVRSLLAGNTLTSSDGLFTFDNVTLTHPNPGPVPLYTGVIGPKSLELSGEIADGTIMSVIAAPKYLEYVKQHVAVGAARSGRDPARHRLPTFVIYNVDTDGDAARAAARAGVAFYLWAIGPSPMTDVYGINDELVSMIDAGGLEAVTAQMPADWLELFAIAGTPADCAAQIPQFLDAGATSLVLAPYPADDLDRMIELTASSVLPTL